MVVAKEKVSSAQGEAVTPKEIRMTFKEDIKWTWSLSKKKFKPMFLGSLLGIAMINFLPGVSDTYDEIKQLHRINVFKRDFIKGEVLDSEIEEDKYRIAGNAKSPSTCIWAIDNKILTTRAYNRAFTEEERTERVNDPLNYLKEACK